jgi:site-specific recombinase XerD
MRRRRTTLWRLHFLRASEVSVQERCKSTKAPRVTYLTEARPPAREAHVFLRVQAPFRPFASASEIAGIVARAVARTGIEGVPTGSHLFRHSLATAMLRGGANLESVGTILRHRSPSTTAIYAKVDITMLEAVAQPWLGGEAC